MGASTYIVVDDLGSPCSVESIIRDRLLRDKSMHRLVLPVCSGSHGGLVRVVGTEELHVDAADAVVGVIIGHIRSQRPGTDIGNLYATVER